LKKLYINEICADLTPIGDCELLEDLHLYRSYSVEPDYELSLAGFERLKNLRFLKISEAWVYDISQISGMESLESLEIDRGNGIDDLKPISSLWNLKHLDLGISYSISTVLPLSECKNIQYIHIEISRLMEKDDDTPISNSTMTDEQLAQELAMLHKSLPEADINITRRDSYV
jgi:hypothetical protein